MLIARDLPSLLSIVVPVYNEEHSLPLLREQLDRLKDELLRGRACPSPSTSCSARSTTA